VVVTSWYALLAPRGTTPATALQLSKDAAEILNRPAIKDQLKAQALAVWTMNPDELRDHMKAETASWARIIKAKNITTE
jgi:tripartite-type tricarboxylate transporter receptor subunit TctC